MNFTCSCHLYFFFFTESEVIKNVICEFEIRLEIIYGFLAVLREFPSNVGPVIRANFFTVIWDFDIWNSKCLLRNWSKCKYRPACVLQDESSFGPRPGKTDTKVEHRRGLSVQSAMKKIIKKEIVWMIADGNVVVYFFSILSFSLLDSALRNQSWWHLPTTPSTVDLQVGAPTFCWLSWSLLR